MILAVCALVPARVIRLLLLPFVCISAAVAQQFLPAANYAVGTTPTHVAVGDFNGDGKLDLAVANYVSGNVSVLLGNGDGTFRAHVDYATSGPAESIAVADFNGDGRLDLAVANDAQDVSVLLGNGDGTFQMSAFYPAGSNEIAVSAVDLNGDGKIDLVVGTRLGTLTVLLGNGNGTFQPLPGISVGSGIYGLATADFNGDGKPDLVLPDLGSNSIHILLGNGDGTFQPPVAYDVGGESATVAVADLNGDGKLDLAVATLSGHMSVLLGNGDGTFQSAHDYSAGITPYSVAIRDFNGDGKPDIVVSDLDSNTVTLLIGNGDGTFGQRVDYAAGGSSPISLAAGDFNGDGWPDVAVVTENGTNTVSVLLNAGPGTGTPAASVTPASIAFGAQTPNTSSAYQPVVVTNIGTGLLEINSVTFAGSNASDFLLSNGCGMTLPVGASCTVQVAFQPTACGIRTGALNVADDTTASPQTVALSGIGDALGLSVSSLNFGGVAVGSSSSQTLTLTNVCGMAFSINPLSISGVNQTDYSQTNTCRSSLAPRSSCTATVTFAPGVKGPLHASLSIPNRATGMFSVLSVPLTGTGK